MGNIQTKKKEELIKFYFEIKKKDIGWVDFFYKNVYISCNILLTIQNDELTIYDLSTKQVINQVKYYTKSLITKLSNNVIVLLHLYGKKLCFYHIDSNSFTFEDFPETKNKEHYHDILGINDNLFITFNKSAVYYYYIKEKKIETIQLTDNPENFLDSFRLCQIMGYMEQINSNQILIFYRTFEEYNLYLLDIEAKQIVANSPMHDICKHRFFNPKTGKICPLNFQENFLKKEKHVRFLVPLNYTMKGIMDIKYRNKIYNTGTNLKICIQLLKDDDTFWLLSFKNEIRVINIITMEIFQVISIGISRYYHYCFYNENYIVIVTNHKRTIFKIDADRIKKMIKKQ